MADPITTAETTPKSVATAAGKVEARDGKDLIALDRYQAAKAARSSPFRGVIFAKIIPAAAIPDSQGTNIGNGSGNFDSAGL